MFAKIYAENRSCRPGHQGLWVGFGSDIVGSGSFGS